MKATLKPSHQGVQAIRTDTQEYVCNEHSGMPLLFMSVHSARRWLAAIGYEIV